MTIPMMTRETFAGGCLDFCSNLTTSTPQDQRDACDTGSFEACKTINDIDANANCKPFIDRIYGTKNNIANTLKVTKINDYYTTISSLVDQYCTNDSAVRTGFCKTTYAPTYITNDVTKKDTYYYNLMQSILGDPTYNTNKDSLITTHLSSDDFKAWRQQKINAAISTYTKSVTTTVGNVTSTKLVANTNVFDFYNTNSVNQPFKSLYMLFPSLFTAIDDSITLNDTVLSTPNISFIIPLSTSFVDRLFLHIKSQLSTRRTNFQDLLKALSEFILNVKYRPNSKLPTGNSFLTNNKFISLENLIGTAPADGNFTSLKDGLLAPIIIGGSCLIGTNQALCMSFIDVSNYDATKRGTTVTYRLPNATTDTTGTYEQSLLRIPTTILSATNRDIVYDGTSILNNIIDNVVFLKANVDCSTTDLLSTDQTKRNTAVSKVFGSGCNVPFNDNTIFDDQDKLNITKYCLGVGKGTPSCRNVSTGQLVPSRTNLDWYKLQTKNITNPDGSITAICGNADKSVFSVAECQDICTTFPEVCKEDAIAKCSLPNYRFSNDKTTFSNKEKYENCEGEEFYSDDEELPSFRDSYMYYVLLLIIVVMSVSIIGQTMFPCTKKELNTRSPQNIYMDINTQKI